MNINHLKEKRTKYSGLVSILLLFVALALMFADFVTESRIDTGSGGFCCLAVSFVFAILGLIRGNKDSLGYTLCFPSIFVSLIAVVLVSLASATMNADNGSNTEKNGKNDAKVLYASNYIYQYDNAWGKNTGSVSYYKNDASALLALCEAYDFFDDENFNPDTAFLMSIFEGFETAPKTDEKDSFFTVTKYFQGCYANTYDFYMLYSNEDAEIICIKEKRSDIEKYFVRYKKSGITKHLEDIFGGYEKALNEAEFTTLERQIAYTYYLFCFSELSIRYGWNQEAIEEYSNYKQCIEWLGFDYRDFLKNAEIEKTREKTNARIRLYRMMKKVFMRQANFSEIAAVLFSDILYNNYERIML